MDLQLFRKLGLLDDQEMGDAAGAPGRSTLTSRLTPAPQVIFQVQDAESATRLGDALRSGRAAPEAAAPAADRTPAPAIARSASNPGHFATDDPFALHLLGGSGIAAERDANGVAPGAGALVSSAMGTGGQPLPDALRSSFEGALGADLGGVTVHTGAESAQSADAAGATAYAVGQQIHFADGAYDPGSKEGQTLLAHEVVHTVQQSGGAAAKTQFKLEVSTPGDAHEVEADQLAEQMVARSQAPAAESTALAPLQAATSLSGGSVARSASDVPVISRWRARDKHGFRRSADVPWCLENPKDPWNGGAQDYVAASDFMGPVSDEPGDLGAINCSGFPEPLNGISQSSGGPYDLPPGVTVDKANSAIDAMQSVCSSVVAAHNGAAAQVRQFANAQQQVGDGGMFGPAPTGVNWQPPAAGKDTKTDVGQLAEDQKPNGGKASVGDIFKDKAGNSGNDVTGIGDKTMAAGKQEDVSKALEKARGMDQGVKDATVGYGNHISESIGNAARAVKDAFSALQMSEEEKKKDGAEAKLASLEKEKADAIGVVSGASTAITKIGKVLSGDQETVQEGIVFLADKVISAQFEADINKQKGEISAAKSRIKSIEADRVQRGIETALTSLGARISELSGKRAAVAAALKARQDAYDEAAKLAEQKAVAKGADKGEADRLRTAIAAIPRIELVISRIGAVLGASGVPAYDATAGVAYAVSKKTNKGLDTGSLENAIGLIKAFNARFTSEKTEWEAKLKSANAIASGLNVGGT